MTNSGKHVAIIALTLAWLVPLPATARTLIFVDDDAQGANDGTSWQNAYNDLQDALDESCMAPGLVDIWVAEGVYKPDRGTGDRMMSFELHDGLALYGGFAGDEDPATFDLIDRNFAANETILSGDLLDNDDPDFVPESDCCFGTVGQFGCDTPSCIEDINNCEDFEACHHWAPGCEVYAMLCCCEICRPSRCDNTAHVLTAAIPRMIALVDGLTLEAGEANVCDEEDGFFGGGLYANFSEVTITNCTFRDNAAAGGSAVHVSQSVVNVFTSTFDSNVGFGGASALSSPTLNSHVSITDSLFVENDGAGATLTVGTGDFQALIRCVFTQNGGTEACRISGGSGAIVECEITGNHGRGVTSAATMLISSTTVSKNKKQGSGAGLGNTWITTVSDSVFQDNSATGSGGGINTDLATLAVRGTTISGNHANDAGGIYAGLGTTEITNTVVWGNTTDAPGSDVQITPFPQGNLSLSWSCVQDWEDDWGGTNVFTDDPLFVDELGPDGDPGTGDENYRLSAGSPLINMGDPDFEPDDDQSDLDKLPRVLCGRVDIGAYEFGIGDYDCDRDVDLADFAGLHGCLTGPNAGPYPAGCEAFDYVFQTSTGTTSAIDLRDVSRALRGLQGE